MTGGILDQDSRVITNAPDRGAALFHESEITRAEAGLRQT